MSIYSIDKSTYWDFLLYSISSNPTFLLPTKRKFYKKNKGVIFVSCFFFSFVSFRHPWVDDEERFLVKLETYSGPEKKPKVGLKDILVSLWSCRRGVPTLSLQEFYSRRRASHRLRGKWSTLGPESQGTLRTSGCDVSVHRAVTHLTHTGIALLVLGHSTCLHG